jgi:hypothetical protein
MKKRLAAALLLSIAFCLYPSPGQSQDKNYQAAPFAPKWEVGDWWIIETFTPDLERAITGRPKIEPRKGKPLELPGFPKARPKLASAKKDIPKGFERGCSFRLEVIKTDAQLSAPRKARALKGAGKKAERYYMVKITKLGISPKREVLVLYGFSDLALGEIRYLNRRAGQRSTFHYRGTVVFSCSQNASFAFPFDWPDMVAALKKEAVVDSGEQRIVQKQSSHENKDKSKTYTVTLKEKETRRGEKNNFVVTQSWRPGRPFWTKYQSAQMHGRLVKWKRKKDKKTK